MLLFIKNRFFFENYRLFFFIKVSSLKVCIVSKTKTSYFIALFSGQTRLAETAKTCICMCFFLHQDISGQTELIFSEDDWEKILRFPTLLRNCDNSILARSVKITDGIDVRTEHLKTGFHTIT